MRGLCRHLSVGLLAATTVALLSAQETGATSDTFAVVLRSARIGSETISVAHHQDGWLISSTGYQGPPVNVTVSKLELQYTADWQPEHFDFDGTLHSQPLTLSTTFSPTSASTDVVQNGKRSVVTHVVSPKTIVIPTGSYAGYEAVAARVAAAGVGARLPVYVPPQGEVFVTVKAVRSRRIATPTRSETFREYDLVFAQSSGPLETTLLVDDRDRLARLDIPSTSISVIREDLASVMARDETARNAADTGVFIPLLGSNLAGTITAPGTSGRFPAVVLAPGFNPDDRDHTVGGVAIYSQLAGALAHAGLLTLRYDRRDSGQSGVRADNAGIPDFADDLVAVVKWLREQKHVDPDRVAVLAYDEAGAVALTAAAGDTHIRALALLDVPGRSGRQVVLDEQARLLKAMTLSDADKQGRMALEQRIIRATLTGIGWDTLPPAVRPPADTESFRSWLLFDPANVMPRLTQPLLLVQGGADTEVTVSDADRLESLGRERKGSLETRKVVVPGVTHRLVPETTAGSTGSATTISPDLTLTVTSWLHDVLGRTR